MVYSEDLLKVWGAVMVYSEDLLKNTRVNWKLYTYQTCSINYDVIIRDLVQPSTEARHET